MDKIRTVCVDMDDVIYFNVIADAIGNYLNIPFDPVGKDYFLQNYLDPKYHDDFWRYFFSCNRYDSDHISPGCYEVLNGLNETSKLHICSSYMIKGQSHQCGIFAKYKHDALLRDFPFLTQNQICLTNDKSIIKTDIMIDDVIKNAKIASIMGLLFSAYHNLNVPNEELACQGLQRAQDWQDVGRILLLK